MKVRYNNRTKTIVWTDVPAGTHSFSMEVEEVGSQNPPTAITLDQQSQKMKQFSVTNMTLEKGKEYLFRVTALNQQGIPIETGEVTMSRRSWRRYALFAGICLTAIVMVGLIVWLVVPMFKSRKATKATPALAATSTATTNDLQRQIDVLQAQLAAKPSVIVKTQLVSQVVTQNTGVLVPAVVSATPGATTVTVTSAPPVVSVVYTNTTSVSNILQLLHSGGLVGNDNILVFGQGNVVVNGNSNVITVGGNSTAKRSERSSGPAVATQPSSVWPQDFTPTRTIKAAECLLTSGCESFKLATETIRAGDDVKVVIPNGWNVEWHSTANQGQIEVAKDGRQYRPFDDRTAPAGGDGAQHREWRFRLASGLPEARLELTFKKL